LREDSSDVPLGSWNRPGRHVSHESAIDYRALTLSGGEAVSPSSPGSGNAEALRRGLVVGAIVERNPSDWKWGDQDGGAGSRGRIVKVEPGWVKVDWERAGKNSYRAGKDSCFDVKCSPVRFSFSTRVHVQCWVDDALLLLNTYLTVPPPWSESPFVSSLSSR
jgi:hypothetical protein